MKQNQTLLGDDHDPSLKKATPKIRRPDVPTGGPFPQTADDHRSTAPRGKREKIEGGRPPQGTWCPNHLVDGGKGPACPIGCLCKAAWHQPAPNLFQRGLNAILPLGAGAGAKESRMSHSVITCSGTLDSPRSNEISVRNP